MADFADGLLDAWLARVRAVALWETVRPAKRGDASSPLTITCYQINRQLAVVFRYSDRNGWELFVPSSGENSVVASLDGAALALGVEGCRGLVDDPATACGERTQSAS